MMGHAGSGCIMPPNMATHCRLKLHCQRRFDGTIHFDYDTVFG
jgi:hypothetical protein